MQVRRTLPKYGSLLEWAARVRAGVQVMGAERREVARSVEEDSLKAGISGRPTKGGAER